MPRSRPGVRVVGAVQPGQIDPSFKTAVRVLQSRLTLRIPRAGIVERRALIHQLKRASDAGVVAVVAPAGYGKTTLLAQWAGRDPRRFASLSFDRSFNDPAVLLTYLTFALAQAVEVGPEVFERLIALHPPERAEVLAGLAAAVARSPTPFVLVLDDVHLLTDAEGIQALNTLAEHVPQGSQLAVAARREPPLQLARTRSEGGLLEIGAPDAMKERGLRSS